MKLFIVIILGAVVTFTAEAKNFLDFSNKESVGFAKATGGKLSHSPKGLNFRIPAGKEGKVVLNPPDKVFNMVDWVKMSLDIINNGDKEVRFELFINGNDPRKRWGGKKTFSSWHIGWVMPSETRNFHMPLLRNKTTSEDYDQQYLKDFPGMRGLPQGIILNFAGVDASRITQVIIKFPKSNVKRDVTLKRLYASIPAVPPLYKKNKAAFFPFINKYGQAKHLNWTGKITDDAQFAQAIKKEQKYLAEYSGSPEWNEYGGWKNGPKLKATGRFRVAKLKGKWWIIDPAGKLFWSTGVNSAGKLTVGTTDIKKRKRFFEWIPAKKSKYGEHVSGNRNVVYFGSINLERKYGAGAADKYPDLCMKRMRSWGFNTMGGWSYDEVSKHPVKKRVPYTTIINAITPAFNEKFPDVFDPEWEKSVREKVKAKAMLVKNDPYFFGFFINNEIHWPNQNGLVKYLKKKPKSAAAKKFAKVGDVAKFYTLMCETYFKITRKAIDDFAPGSLYLGCRWHGTSYNKTIVTIAAQYLDIFSYNIYRNEIEKFLFWPGENGSLDKPFIATEFNFGALDTGKFFTGLGWASDQRNRGEKYRNYVQGALRNPRCVGTHWFMWGNSTTAGKGNGENANCGLVDATDQPYYELLGYIRETTYKMYQYRSGNN